MLSFIEVQILGAAPLHTVVSFVVSAVRIRRFIQTPIQAGRFGYALFLLSLFDATARSIATAAIVLTFGVRSRRRALIISTLLFIALALGEEPPRTVRIGRAQEILSLAHTVSGGARRAGGACGLLWTG